MAEKNIVNRMIEFQKSKGLTDLQFAKSLNIWKESWQRNKKTKVIDARVLHRSFFVYPELREIFLIDATDRIPHEKPQEGKLARLKNKVISFYAKVVDVERKAS